ncbi:MAG: DUF4907 domain-containing protein [Flavobacteriales bacterium]|nr:DUF4907 domain-containing protein [Flavobacteriales bacterium]
MNNALRILLPLAFAALLVPANAQLAHPVEAQPASAETSTTSFPAADEHKGAVLTSHIIDAPNGTYGYDILSDGKLFVHQTNLPGRPGNSGCATKADAEKLAAFVIEKIKKGEMPPTVTQDELKTLGLLR